MTLIASGLGDDTGGGIYRLGDDGVEPIDHLSTTGLAVADDGRTLARLLFTDDDPQTSGELLLYDARGVAAYRRVDALQEPHGAVWHDGRLVVVSTLTNGLLWLDANGVTLREWHAPGDGDCWHVNSPAVWGDRLIASAFGRFNAHRDWARPGAREGSGVVFDVETGEDLITGLTCPHDPLPFADGWLVCNSGERELLRLAPDGRVLQRVALGGWTRGLAYDDEHVYVGVSAHRLLGGEGRARVAVLERETLRELRSWTLPCRDVFALVHAPPELVAGLRTGFATNPYRVLEGVALDGSARGARTVTRPLETTDRRIVLTIEDPASRVAAGGWLTIRYALENRGGGTLASAGDHPVYVLACFSRDGLDVPGTIGRARLSATVGPGGGDEGVLRLPAPAEPGNYRLRVAVGQEGLGWFDELDGGFEPWDALIDVVGADAVVGVR